MAAPSYFGIRHHGPGCARSLIRAFDAHPPDCVLIEGPPEADALIALVADEGMRPPVALLNHCPDEPSLAVYHPFAVFSPEWQALRWSVTAKVTARFIDLPTAHMLALERQRVESERARASGRQPEEDDNPEAGTEVDRQTGTGTGEGALDAPDRLGDPLDWLARAAGYADGESWWNHMVEERGDGEQLFAAIADAMTTLRAETGERDRTPEEARREALREAHMRQSIRAVQKDGFERIAVVCGAWHLGGLMADVPAKADQALLKGLPKVKVGTTWVPWTYRHLTRASGYGAGIRSPGWYEHLWWSEERKQPRGIGWLARVAGLMRARDLDCSSAHLIEAARLADALAALRERPAPGLDELHEATRTVLTLGDESVLHFIADALVVGDRLGAVPAAVPTVPRQRDVEQAQKRLRLKPESLEKTLDLDLRNATDLERSRLLHRLGLLDVPWGEVEQVGRSSRGTFHEVWTVQWQPEFALRLIEASQWGQTVVQAATARVVDRCARAETLAELSSLVDRVLLADLVAAVGSVTRALEDRAALTGDAQQLLEALPPLANVFRYGNVRQTDAAMVAHVLDGLIVRASIGLPLATAARDDAAAGALRRALLAAHSAVGLRDGAEQTAAWQRALDQLASMSTAHELLQGVATRLLLDAGVWTGDRTAVALSLHLSAGAEPAKAAAWLDGFLNRNAVVLLHDATVWRLVNAWLAGLTDEHFVRVLPLVRRSFSQFAPGERRDLGQRARQGAAITATGVAEADWDERRAVLPLPLLRELMGLTS
jgi:hypothetical protein